MNVFKTAAVLTSVILSVSPASGEIKPMASREYVDRKVGPKRDKDDLKIYRKRKDVWTFTNWAASGEDHPAPAEFLAAANAANFGPLRYLGGWMGATVYWPNGNIRFAQPAGTYPPGGADALEINFILAAYDATGTNQLYTFGATATRVSATDETLVEHDWARLMTDDAVAHQIAGATNALRKIDGTARPLPKYLWCLNFDDAYPDDAAWYYAQPQPYGLCSAMRKGGFLFRNYDWNFDRMAEFVVLMSAGKGRFASVGVANAGTNLTEEIVASGQPSRYYKCLPGHTVDGINANGVVAEVNVVSTNGVENWRGNPATDGIHCMGAVRWALDLATNAQHAATELARRVYVPQGMGNFHYMIADESETWIVENGDAQQVDERFGSRPRVMTNFRSLTTPGAFEGEGKERYEFLLYGDHITDVWYTHAYDRYSDWISDFGYDYDLMRTAIDLWSQKPKEEHRGESSGGYTWWQTVHTSVYDITNRVLRIAVQENNEDWYTFQLPSRGGGVDKDEVKAIVNQVIGEQTRRYAMFIIHLNDAAYSPSSGYFTQFELKASTNNFEGPYENRCCFYSHSGHADGEYSTNDRMHLFINHGGVDQRSYVRIPSTLDLPDDYAPSEIVAIVDAALMNRARSDGAWLREDNDEITWTWVRLMDDDREIDPDPNLEHCLWRPIAPVRWFSKLPAWAR